MLRGCIVMGNILLLRRAEEWNTQWWCFDAASRRQLCSWFEFDSILCGSQRHRRKRAFVVEKWGSHSSEFSKKRNRTCSNSYSSTFLVCFFSWNRVWHRELTLRSFRCRTGDFHPSHSAAHLAFMLLSPIKAELYLLLFPWVFWLQVSTACMHMRGRSGMGKVLFYQLECFWFFFPVAWLTKLLSLKSWPGRGSEWGLMQLPCLKKLGLEAAEREVC